MFQEAHRLGGAPLRDHQARQRQFGCWCCCGNFGRRSLPEQSFRIGGISQRRSDRARHQHQARSALLRRQPVAYMLESGRTFRRVSPFQRQQR